MFVALRFSFGKIQQEMDCNSTVKVSPQELSWKHLMFSFEQDLYQLAMACGGLKEPFTISTLIPRSPIPLSELPLQNYDIEGKVMVVEGDAQRDFTKFLNSWYVLISVCSN